MKNTSSLLRLAAVLALIVTAAFAPSAYGLKITAITLTVVPNPYHTTATATAVFTTAPQNWQIGNVNLTINLWDDDSWFRDSDDLLGTNAIVVAAGAGIPNQVWELSCDDDDEVQGPAGGSGENDPALFVQVEGHAAVSNSVTVTQQECDIARLEMDGSSNVVVGNNAIVEMAIGDTSLLQDFKSLAFGVTYDQLSFSVQSASFANPQLIQFGNVNISQPGAVLFTANLPFPLNLQGMIGRIEFHALLNAPPGTEKPFEYTAGSHFYNSLGQPMILSFFDNHTLTLLPADTSPPVINSSHLSISQYSVSGSAGAVSDNWMQLPNDVYVEVYDLSNTLVSFAVANNLGAFYMDHFWMVRGTSARIRAWDLLQNVSEYPFTVPTSYLPVLLNAISGGAQPGQIWSLNFDLFNRCDLAETYNVNVSSSQGWTLNPALQPTTLPSFTDATLQVGVSVPANAQIGMVDTLTAVATSTSDPTSTAMIQATLTVLAPNITVNMAPVNPPIIIQPNGGNFNYNISATNNETTPQTFDVWVMVTLPNGAPYGPVVGSVALTLSGGGSIARNRTQIVPGSAPAGNYAYTANVGDYPGSVWDFDSFTFTKLASGDGGAWVGQWQNIGEPFGVAVVSAPTSIPEGYLLAVVRPNPFNPSTVLNLELPVAGLVNLSVYDLAGRRVAQLINGWREAGAHEIAFDGSQLPSGVYLARLEAGSYRAMQKLILLK